jgi:hypothetical protein
MDVSDARKALLNSPFAGINTPLGMRLSAAPDPSADSRQQVIQSLLDSIGNTPPPSGLFGPNEALASAFGQMPPQQPAPPGMMGPPYQPPAPSPLDMLKQYATTAASRPGSLDLAQAQNAGSLAGLQAQAAALAKVPLPAFTPYTPAPYPTPQFAPIPERQAPQSPPPAVSALAAIASLFAGPYAGQISASPLEASKALADQQYRDAYQRYEAQEAQKDELNRYALAAYQNNQGVDLQNLAGQRSAAEQAYDAALQNAGLAGKIGGAQALGGALAPLVTQDHAATAAAGNYDLLQAAIADQEKQRQLQVATQNQKLADLIKVMGLDQRANYQSGSLDVKRGALGVQQQRANDYGQSVDQQGQNIGSQISNRQTMAGIAQQRANTEANRPTKAAQRLLPQESRDPAVRSAFTDWSQTNAAYLHTLGTMGPNDASTRNLSALRDAAAARLQAARDAFQKNNAAPVKEYDFVGGRLVPHGGR